MFKRSLIAVALLASSIVSAHAADEKLNIPAVLAKVQSTGSIEVLKSFPAAGGLTGWVAVDVSSKRNIILYTTADNSLVISGMALDKDGANVTAKYASEHFPPEQKIDYTPAFAAFSKDAASVVVGSAKAKAEVTVVFDANCGYCKLMHKMLKPAVEANELRVRYVPVAILGGDSDVKGAGILAGKATVGAIEAGSSSDKAELLKKVAENTALMKKYGFNGTPVVMYKAKVGGEDTLYVSPGVPNVGELFAKLGINGQIDKLKADPQMARFVTR